MPGALWLAYDCQARVISPRDVLAYEFEAPSKILRLHLTALMSFCNTCNFGCHFLHALTLGKTLLVVQLPLRRSRISFKSLSFTSAWLSRVGMEALSISDKELRSSSTAAT